MPLRQEIQDVVDRWTEARADGELSPEEIHSITRDVLDVLKEILSIDASSNARNELADEFENAIERIVAVNFANRPIVRAVISSFIDTAADKIVDAVADYTGTAEDFWLEYVDPVLARWEATIHKARTVAG